MGPEGEGGQEGGMSGPDPRTPVLRISQLDAFELDSALEQLLWTQFSQCFQNLGPALLTPLEPELKVLLQLLVWRFSLYPRSSSVGQTLLGLRFHNALSHATRYRALTRRQRLGLLLLGAGPSWLRERSHSLLRSLGAGPESGALSGGLRKGLVLLSGLVQTASLVNFLVFLRKGRYPSLSERILGVRAVFSRSPGVRDVAFQYVNRELLWHGFAEFLIFLLPLVDTRRAKTALRRFLSGSAAAEEEGGALGGRGECGYCGEWPTMPHTIGCPHVFCYYCVKSHAIAHGYLTCPRCGQEAAGAEPVQLQIEMAEIPVR